MAWRARENSSGVCASASQPAATWSLWQYATRLFAFPLAKDLVKSLLTVDPAKRSTPEIALKHPWIAGEEASTKNIMDTFKEGLKKNPRERLRAAVAKVQAMRAFRNAMGAGKDGEEVPEASE